MPSEKTNFPPQQRQERDNKDIIPVASLYLSHYYMYFAYYYK